MHQTPIVSHGFNHQSFYRQPISNLRQIHEVVSNRNNETQHIDNVTPSSFPSISNQQPIFEHMNLEKEIKSPLNDNIQQQIELNRDSQDFQQRLKKLMINNQESGFAKDLLGASKTNNTVKRQSRSTGKPSNVNQNRLLSRQTSLELKPNTDNISPQGSTSLANSYSAGDLYDSIRRERKAHTMAPSTRISGPISAVKSNMFAKIAAPIDSQAMKSSSLTQPISNETLNFYSQPGVEMNGVVNDGYGPDEDDNAPIIVKVRYDPETGEPPSEEAIRQMINNRLQGQPNGNFNNDPIVLNFTDNTIRSSTSQESTRPEQLYFNQSPLTAPSQVNHPNIRMPSPSQQQYQQQNLQLLHRQHPQQFVQQQQQFVQQQQQFQLQQKRQQQLQLQQKQQQQLQLQQRQKQQQQQRQLQLQQYQLQQKEQLQRQQLQIRQREQFQQRLQQQKEQQQVQLQRKEQVQRLRQELLLQQQKQKQQLQQFLQQQNERKQQILQTEEQQRYRQLLQKQQELRQRQQQTFQQKHRNPSLPPMGPRPSRTTGPIRPMFINQPSAIFPQNKNIRPIQPIPILPMPVKTSDNISTINIQRLPYRNFSSTQPNSPISSDMGAFENYSRKQTPSLFIPINFGMPNEPQSIPISKSTSPFVSPYSLQRPYTAPSSSEMYRPSSALDIPELSQENLRDMLNQIPDLHGRQFHIEYMEPTDPDGYPVPSPLDHNNDKYPVPVFVDQLPNNIIQHVRSSNNLALQAALDPAGQAEKNFQLIDQPQRIVPMLNGHSSTLLNHNARPKQNVQRYRSLSLYSSDNITDTYTYEKVLKLNKYQ
ncbi:unnamed protein product [Rotaria sp. Silwood2]|nr:unnamed protein product [Rotaria sp. Silwood2]CAF2473982.1 unnamed protein product [Rotaria sp. Silwood2]CAF4056201.1 unnamed protein product [Rotaria sp. Silwood2]CAF4275883.1 unnamed protein product [Rotaria sp. Silwood2]